VKTANARESDAAIRLQNHGFEKGANYNMNAFLWFLCMASFRVWNMIRALFQVPRCSRAAIHFSVKVVSPPTPISRDRLLLRNPQDGIHRNRREKA